MKLIKLLLTVILSAIFVFASFPVAAEASQNTWDPNNGVYDISTVSDFLEFRDCMNNGNTFDGNTISLKADIDFSGADYICPNENNALFSGQFEGNNHTISNMKMISSDSSTVGLFPVLYGTVAIKDLYLSDITISNCYNTTGVFCPYAYQSDVIFENCHLIGNSSITNNNNPDGMVYCAAFVPLQYFSNIDIINCSLGDDVSVDVTFVNCAIASFISFAYSDSSSGLKGANLIGCTNNASINAAISVTGTVGGLVGWSDDWIELYINKCANNGNITSNQTNTGDPCGGLIAYTNASFIYNSYNTGNITTTNANGVGGLIGQIRTNDNSKPYQGPIDIGVVEFPEQHNSVFNCYNVGNVSGGNSQSSGGVIGMLQEHSTQQGNSIIKNVYNFGTVSGEGKVGSLCAESEGIFENAFFAQGTNAIESVLAPGGNVTGTYTNTVGYYSSASNGGNVYKGTIIGNETNISSTPLETDLKETLDEFVDEQNAVLEENSNTFRYLPWTYSDGSDELGIHPVFGYDIVNEAPESKKAENGGYVTTSRNGFEYYKFDTEESKTVTVTAVPEAGKTLKSITATDQNGNDVALTDKGNGTYTFEMPKADVTINAQFAGKSEPNNTVFLTTKDSVDITFIIDADYYTNDPDAYAVLNYNHNPKTYQNDFYDETVKLSDVEKTDDGRYVFKIVSAPAQLTETIKIALYDTRSGEPLYDVDYSMWQYCQDIISQDISIKQNTDVSDDIKERWDKAADVCRALTDYATVAQVYFEYNQADMASKGVADEATYYSDDVTNEIYYHNINDITLDTMKAAQHKPTASISGNFSIAHTSLMSLSNTEVRFYYDNDEIDPNDYTLTLSVDDWYGNARPTARFSSANSGTFISVGGIESANLDNTFTLQIKKKSTDEVTTIRYNAIAYCYTVIRNTAGSDDQKEKELASLVKAIYLYNQYADDYFQSPLG